MSLQPFFSIMVPTYNQAGFLGECLTSLIAQNDPDWEAVVVDDGSTDDTPRALEAFAFKDPRIRPFRRENGGAAAALNTALENCRGRFVCWLSSDDLFEPDKLSIHRQAIAQNPHVRFFHTHFYQIEEEHGGMKTAPPHWRPMPEPGLEVARFFSGNYVSGITVCVEREALKSAGPFREDLRHGQDFAMWLTLSRTDAPFFIDRRTAVTRYHSGQSAAVFPVAGLYDSAWALIEYLNERPYGQVFPSLDLDDPDQAVRAVRETLDICLSPASFLHQLGYTPALALRLLEWMGARQGSPGARAARAAMEEAVRGPAFAAAPVQAREMIASALAHEGARPYRPEPPADFVRRVIATPGTDERKRRNLIRYLDKKNTGWKSA